MLCEFQLQNKDFSTTDMDLATKLLDESIIDTVVIHPFLLSYKEKYQYLLPATSVLIDYPFGLQLSKQREFEVIMAVKQGVSSVDITINQIMLNNGEYGNILKELKTFSKLKSDYNVIIRVIVDYTLSTQEDIEMLALELPEYDISTMISSTMMYTDNPVDNVIFSQNISSKSSIGVVAASNMWLPRHHQLCSNAGLFGFRSNSINFLSKLQKMVYNN